MHSIDLIRLNLERSEAIVLARIEDMRGDGLVPPTINGGCHTVWVLGHLAYIEGAVIQHIMQGQPNPLDDWEDPFDGADVSGDPAHYPPFDRVLAACRAARASTRSVLERLTEDDLDRASARTPPGAEALMGTWRLCLQYAADHWFMHRGHLADARRAAGLERAWY